jgi:hypothetical protein
VAYIVVAVDQCPAQQGQIVGECCLHDLGACCQGQDDQGDKCGCDTVHIGLLWLTLSISTTVPQGLCQLEK